MEASTIQETDEERVARLEAEQAELDAEDGHDSDGRDLPDGAADDGDPVEGAGDAQDGLFDQVVEDEGLSDLLEERERRRVKAAKAKADLKEKADVVKARLDALELEPGTVVRCGRFRVKTTRVEGGKDVEFTTVSRIQRSIKLIDA